MQVNPSNPDVVLPNSLRILLIVGYIWLIGRSSEIQRVFQYHGAEHKTIHAYESGDPLGIEEIQRYSPRHPRCGTSFLIIVALVAFFAISVMDNWRGARLDLTSDKLFTMSPAASKILQGLQVPVQVKLYITPSEKMPTQLRTLERDITEQMRNFEQVSDGMLKFQVFNPQDDEEMQMTPMIDIVFQLLVFFIMTLKIVSQEGDFNIKMPIGAPREGLPDPHQLPPLKLKLRANSAGQLTSMQLNQKLIAGAIFGAHSCGPWGCFWS